MRKLNEFQLSIKKLGNYSAAATHRVIKAACVALDIKPKGKTKEDEARIYDYVKADNLGKMQTIVTTASEGFTKPKYLDSVEAEEAEFTEVDDSTEEEPVTPEEEPASRPPSLTEEEENDALVANGKGIPEILSYQREIDSHQTDMIHSGIAIGGILKAYKRCLKHGEWAGWVKKNLPFQRSMAAKYVKAWDNREYLHQQILANESLTTHIKSIEDLNKAAANAAKGEDENENGLSNQDLHEIKMMNQIIRAINHVSTSLRSEVIRKEFVTNLHRHEKHIKGIPTLHSLQDLLTDAESAMAALGETLASE